MYRKHYYTFNINLGKQSQTPLFIIKFTNLRFRSLLYGWNITDAA